VQRLTQNRAVSRRISTPASRRKSASAVASQYRHTPYATPAVTCTCCVPVKIGMSLPVVFSRIVVGVTSSPVTVDSQA
jgi:hypothetical protein